jgi:signal transduction histidine kinase
MPTQDETKTTDILSPFSPVVAGHALEQELYKKNAELDMANELLSLTRKLYQISLLSLSPEALAEHIATLMRDSLHLEMAGIFLFDRDHDTLTPLYFAKSERLISVFRKDNFLLRDITITDVTKRPTLKKLFDGDSVVTANLADVWGGLINDSVLKDMSVLANIKTTIAHPLLTEERVIGVMILGLTSDYEQIWTTKKESLRSFADIIAVALDKSYTYQELNAQRKNLTVMYQQMVEANKKLKTVDETKSSILSFAQHYLQNPITDIVMASSMLADGSFGDKIEDIKKASVKLLESARHLSLTVKMWLRALDFEENRVEYKMENFDLADMVNKISKDWTLIAQNRSINFSFETDNHPPYTVNGDQIWMHEVIINLIDNAFKMTEKGFIKLKVEKIGIETIRFSITDSGVGIEGETLPTLFQKFERGRAGWKNNVEGTGLGLYISKKIVEEGHHGRIWADSEGAGKGATFYVELNQK